MCRNNAWPVTSPLRMCRHSAAWTHSSSTISSAVPLGCFSSPSSVWLPSTTQSVRCPAALAHRCRPPSSARHTDFVDLADQVRCCTCTPHFCWRCAAGPTTFRAGLIAGPSCVHTGSWIVCRINHAGVVVRLLVGWAEVLVCLCIG